MDYNGIIIFGEMGSGKDTLADMMIQSDKRIRKYGLGDIIRLIKKASLVVPEWNGRERTYMQNTADKLREIDINILNQYALSEMLGENLGKFTLSEENYRKELDSYFLKIREEKNIIPMIVGGRTEADFEFWKDAGFATVGITISDETRKRRLLERDGLETAVNSDSTHNTERDVAEIVKKCRFRADNDGTLEDLHMEAERLTQEITGR